VRIELWGDEVDSIRSFDAESQRSIENLEEVMIYPASEIILPRGRITEAIRRMKEEYEQQKTIFLKDKKRAEKERLRKMVEATRDELTSLGTTTGSESLLSYFYEDTVSFLSWLPVDTMIFFDESRRVLEKAGVSETEYTMSMENRLSGGYILPGHADLMYGREEILGRILDYPLVLLYNLQAEADLPVPVKSFAMNVRSIYSYQSSFEQLIKDLSRWKKEKYQMILMSSSPTRAKRLAADIREYGLPAWFSEDAGKSVEPGEIMVISGRLASGFEYPDVPFVILTEKDIFKDRNQKAKRRQRLYSGQKIGSLTEISIGDYVVHERYGLGIYRGIEQIESEGAA
jgi:transcription-repair coupling factor (superfamily II helicase)